jgi:hypothetical protein
VQSAIILLYFKYAKYFLNCCLDGNLVPNFTFDRGDNLVPDIAAPVFLSSFLGIFFKKLYLGIGHSSLGVRAKLYSR